MKYLQLDDVTARKIYPTAPPEIKQILENTFTKEFFNQTIYDRLNSWQDVAAERGVHPVNDLPYPDAKNVDQISINAYFKLMHITRAFNQGVKLDYDNQNQPKYYGWFRKRPSGFGFDDADTGYDSTSTHVGARLSFVSEKACKHVCTHPEFSKIYNEYYSE